jgi:hypothetical protein
MHTHTPVPHNSANPYTVERTHKPNHRPTQKQDILVIPLPLVIEGGSTVEMNKYSKYYHMGRAEIFLMEVNYLLIGDCLKLI